MEAYAKANNPPNRPIDPGEVRVEGVNPPAFRQFWKPFLSASRPNR